MAYVDEDEDDGGDDREYPDDEEADWNPEPADAFCPHCHGKITEDTQRCPHCGEYLSDVDYRKKKPIWTIIVAIVIVAILICIFAFR